jgi:hypothetical protein
MIQAGEQPAANVIEALQLLAAEATEQIAAFPPFVAVADEIALTLHDALLLLKQDADAAGLPESVLATIEEMDRSLDELSNQTESRFWSPEGLANDVRWHRLRLSARDLLKTLNVPQTRPTVTATYHVVEPDDSE